MNEKKEKIANPERLRKIINQAKTLVTPSLKEKIFIENMKEWLENIITPIVEPFNAKVMSVGSTVKGTWLPNTSDFDVFILCPPECAHDFTPVLRVIEKQFPKIAKEYGLRLLLQKKFSQHPYLYFQEKNFSIDLVPCIDISTLSPKENGELPIMTAVDRTPLHTTYVIKHLSEEQQNEVRLLKRFLKFLGIYGAEVKTQGFSGYLTELLIIYFGSFLKVIKYFARAKEHEVFSLGKYTMSKEEYSKKYEPSPLVFIDPVDPKRNVAAAVNVESMMNMIAGCQAFLRRPGLQYFHEIHSLQLNELMRMIGLYEIDFSILWFQASKVPEEIIWGQLQRIKHALMDSLVHYGFQGASVIPFQNNEKYGFIIRALKQEPLRWDEFIGPKVNSPAFIDYLEASVKNASYMGPYFMKWKVRAMKRRPAMEFQEFLKNYFFEHNNLYAHTIFTGRTREAIEKHGIQIEYYSIPEALRNSNEFLLRLEESIFMRKPWINRIFTKNKEEKA